MPRVDGSPGLSNDSEAGGMQSRLLLPGDRHSDSSDDPLSGVHVMAQMESLDYEVVESAVYKEDQTQRGPVDHVIYASLKWTFALLIGAATGFIAFLINVAVENLAGWKFTATFWVMQYSYILSFIVYVLCNGLLVFSSAVIVTYFAPMAAGSGIPEIKGYLNGIDTPGILLFRTLVGKVFGSLGSVAGGLALGKEGPLVHTGACIASLMGQGGSTKYRITWRWLRVFKNDRDRRDLVTCGAAAGVAAAFRAPVGGVLFALEEVTSWWRSHLLWRVFFTSAVVAVVLRTSMKLCKDGICGHFGSGGFIIWDITGWQDDYLFFELLPMAMLGVMGGLLGAMFNQLTWYVTSWRRRYLHKKGDRVKVIEALLVSLLTSVLSFCLPLMKKCTPCPEGVEHCPRPSLDFDNFLDFHCSAKNEYNDLGTIFFNTQDDAIRNLFSSKTQHEYSSETLLIFFVVFYLLAVITYGINVPSGQFVPGILLGATYGRLIGMLMVKMYNIDEGTYALLGAASFLGGSMRMTVSLCVIMVEITNNLQLLPLIMLVLLISKAVGDGFNHGFYELHAELKQIPILEARPKRFLRHLAAKDAVNRKVVSLSRVERVENIVRLLQTVSHNGFPVIQRLPNGESVFLGLVLRSHLLFLLKSGADFQHSPVPRHTSLNSTRYDVTDFAKTVSSKGLSIRDVGSLSTESLNMHLDLLPFVNPSPYIVAEDMSLTKVYALFRQLGLRHICVVPKPSKVMGIISRKDLLPEVLEDKRPSQIEMTSKGSSFSLAPGNTGRSQQRTANRAYTSLLTTDEDYVPRRPSRNDLDMDDDGDDLVL